VNFNPQKKGVKNSGIRVRECKLCTPPEGTPLRYPPLTEYKTIMVIMGVSDVKNICDVKRGKLDFKNFFNFSDNGRNMDFIGDWVLGSGGRT